MYQYINTFRDIFRDIGIYRKKLFYKIDKYFSFKALNYRYILNFLIIKNIFSKFVKENHYFFIYLYVKIIKKILKYKHLFLFFLRKNIFNFLILLFYIVYVKFYIIL